MARSADMVLGPSIPGMRTSSRATPMASRSLLHLLVQAVSRGGARQGGLLTGSHVVEDWPLPHVHLPPVERLRRAARVVFQHVVLLLSEHLGRAPGRPLLLEVDLLAIDRDVS